LIIHYSSQQTKKSFQIYVKELCIAYRIGSKHKLYFPYACKGNKFQNDYPPNWIEGLLQLKYHKNFIIITKSMKEVLFFREHFDWDTVAGKSETTLIPDHILRELFYKYSKVYIWLDNDSAGRNAQEKYLNKYPTLIPVIYNVEQKDPTDRYEYLKSQNKAQLALEEIKNCIN
jgi:hypothetical protein